MWHDNETDVDLLGFDTLVDTIVYLVQDKSLLPLTIGVFGDWGSGKSSLMWMARQILEADAKYICVSFSPWQHKDYDDVKTALMVAVMTALTERRGLLTSAGVKATRQAQRLWKRINVFRALTFAAKGLGALALATQGELPSATAVAASGVTDLKGLLQPQNLGQTLEEAEAITKEVIHDDDEATSASEEDKPIEQQIGEFREEFAKLLGQLEVEALVVFIDDLDRCLPPTIIDTFEALRLFLAVPKTAFVIGAAERIIRHAIATRYSELSGQSLSIGRDYMEKIIQVPLYIPPLNAMETETYLNLLGCRIHINDEAKYKELVDLAARNRRDAVLDVAMNHGIALTHLKEISADLSQYMALVGHIAPTLSGNFHGNPRQVKRFMNTLLLRRRIAKSRNVDLDAAILAKLMILEYFHESQYRQLFAWQVAGGGIAVPLKALEGALRTKKDQSDQSAIDSDAQLWLDDGSVKAWLGLVPLLADEPLGSYFYFSRGRILNRSMPGRRLSQHLQELLGQLQSESDAERTNGTNAALALPVEEFRPVYEDLLGRFERDPRALDSRLGTLVVELAAKQRVLVPALASALRGAPLSEINPALALSVPQRFGTQAPFPRALEEVLQEWASQKTAIPLATSASRALRAIGR